METKSTGTTTENERLSGLQRKLERHFLTCSAALGAAAVFAPTQEANATIHYFDPADIQIPLNDGVGIYFNLETGMFGTTAGAVPGYDINIFNPNATYLLTFAPAGTGIVGYTLGAYRYSSRLSMGSTIGPAATFLAGGVTTMSYGGIGGQWTGNTSGYLGVQFTLANNSVVYGWIHIEVTNSVNARVTSWAWEDNGGAITAGAIPEPSTVALSLLAAGAAGLAFWRRWKAGAVS